MKKILYKLILLGGLLLLQSNLLKAQYEVGTTVVDLGIGFGTFYTWPGNESPVISASVDHGIVNLGPGVAGNIGIGGLVSYQYDSYGFVPGNFYSYNRFFIAGSGTWHPDLSQYTNLPNLEELYAGIDLGVLIVSETHTGPKGLDYVAAGGGIRGGFILGGRYFFTNNIGGFAELGYDVAFFKVGLAIKFGGK